MSDTGVVLKNCRNRHFIRLSFKMVNISTNCCIINQHTTAINKLITVHIFFLQSGHLIFANCKAMASTAWYNGVDPLETSDERVPKVNRDSWRFFANSDISLYIHLLADLPRV